MEQKLLKKYRPEAVIYLVLTAAALTVAYFKDLQIDIALNNTSNLVANWFAATGEMPASVLLTAAGAFLTKCFQKKWQKVVFGILTVAAGGYLGDFISRRLFEENDFSFGFGIIFGIGIALVFLFALKFIDIPKKYRKPLIAMAFIGIAVIKTGIECALYSIPIEIKFVKNCVAFVADTIPMLVGLFIGYRVKPIIEEVR